MKRIKTYYSKDAALIYLKAHPGDVLWGRPTSGKGRCYKFKYVDGKLLSAVGGKIGWTPARRSWDVADRFALESMYARELKRGKHRRVRTRASMSTNGNSIHAVMDALKFLEREVGPKILQPIKDRLHKIEALIS